MTCDDSDALMRDVVARVECVASESHPRHSVVDLRYLLSGSVMILVYPRNLSRKRKTRGVNMLSRH